MPERERPVDHLARGLEELMRAAAELLAQWRTRSARAQADDALVEALDQLANELSGWLERGDGPWLDTLRTALRQEVERWERRALVDPVAGRVRDLFAAALDLLGSEDEREPRHASARRPPQRKATR